MSRYFLGLALVLVTTVSPLAADKPSKRSPKEALRALHSLIGKWKGTGTPEGSREEKANGLWTESQSWRWQFKGDDAWLVVSFAQGKYFVKGELRFLPKDDAYQLRLLTRDKKTLTFTGRLQDRRLTLDRSDGAAKEDQRLVFSFLHSNRFLFYYQVKPQGRGLFTRVYQVGATKKDVPFAAKGDNQPECIVSGGLGTIEVRYKGKTYYVCCSGCKAEFDEHPEKYIKEYEQKKAKQAK
jgi:hypothetical protein